MCTVWSYVVTNTKLCYYKHRAMLLQTLYAKQSLYNSWQYKAYGVAFRESVSYVNSYVWSMIQMLELCYVHSLRLCLSEFYYAMIYIHCCDTCKHSHTSWPETKLLTFTSIHLCVEIYRVCGDQPCHHIRQYTTLYCKLILQSIHACQNTQEWQLLDEKSVSGKLIIFGWGYPEHVLKIV